MKGSYIVLLLFLLSSLTGCILALHSTALKSDTKTVVSLLDQGEGVDKSSPIPFDVPG